MTKDTMIRNYRKFSAADGYALGFVYKKNLYLAMVDEIMPRFMKVERESSKKGGHRKLQLRLNNKYMKQLIKAGATLLGDESLLIGEYNKGVEFERLVSERNGIEYRGKDSVGFWVSGDLEIDGKQIQVKLNGAQIVVETTLENLKKRA
jgi:hypothetical protein